MNSTEEIAFVRKLKKMDETAWQVFCREYSPPLLNFVRFKFHCNLETAQEIVQMTFVRCVKSIKSFKSSRGRLFDWLKAVSKNEAHTFLQQLNKATPSPESATVRIPYELLQKIDTAALPEEIAHRREVQLLVHETILELYSRYRAVLTLKYIENKKVSEIAAALNQSEKAIESLLSRSRQAFKELFQNKLKSFNLDDEGVMT
jgi:RNA polymerase sigma factor (sigma-70 family)